MIPEQLPVFTAHTISNRARLMEELETVRVEGIAYDREEQTLGICAVGALVWGPTNVRAAISTPVPSVRFYGEENNLIIALKQTCNIISQRYKTT